MTLILGLIFSAVFEHSNTTPSRLSYITKGHSERCPNSGGAVFFFTTLTHPTLSHRKKTSFENKKTKHGTVFYNHSFAAVTFLVTAVSSCPTCRVAVSLLHNLDQIFFCCSCSDEHQGLPQTSVPTALCCHHQALCYIHIKWAVDVGISAMDACSSIWASLIGFLLTQTAFEDSSSSSDDQLMFRTEQSPLGGMFSVLSCVV